MARRLILDTGLLIAAERRRQPLEALLGDEDDVAIAAITLAELHVGVELADGARRVKRQEFVDGISALVPVEDYTPQIAQVHARLLAHVHGQGRPRGAHDLIIAATAAATARVIVTTDAKAAFDELPGVRRVSVS